MRAAQSKRKPVVRRITVDERLAGDLIRLVVCHLADGIEVFYDRQEDWGTERDVWTRPKDYAQKLGAPDVQTPPWESLEEGQLYLSGEFEVVGDRARPAYFRVRPGRREFVRIDNLEEYREGVKHLYSVLLTEGGKDGQPN
jgi:hypothetical protein